MAQNFSEGVLARLTEAFRKARGGHCRVMIHYTSDQGECTLTPANEWVVAPTVFDTGAGAVIPDAFEIGYIRHLASHY